MYPFHLEVTKDYQDLSQYAANVIIQVIKEKPEGLYCFAGGDTPVKTLNLLVDAHKKGEIDLARASYIELDEWVGLDRENPGSCFSYLKRELFDPAGIGTDKLHYFDGQSDHLVEECHKANQVIDAHGGLTLCLLGVGENGHLGFNEPGVAVDLSAHVIALDESTQIVGKKYFSEAVDRSQGITLGIAQLLEAETMIVEASGRKKTEAISHLLLGEVSSEWPVTAVNNHPKCYVVVDEEVLSK